MWLGNNKQIQKEKQTNKQMHRCTLMYFLKVLLMFCFASQRNNMSNIFDVMWRAFTVVQQLCFPSVEKGFLNQWQLTQSLHILSILSLWKRRQWCMKPSLNSLQPHMTDSLETYQPMSAYEKPTIFSDFV